MPFAVGIYEMQIERMDSEMARLFEDYYRQAYGKMLALPPSVHRVIPVNETVQAGIEIKPFESVAEIINAARAWGVLDCICRKQKALIGQPCHHPLGMCMVLSETSGVFDQSATVRPLTRDNAMATLRQAAEAGLVHSVSNNQRGNWYICNCCTCSCAVLRGIAELGLANAVARSAFVNRVNEGLCGGCGLCLEACQFGALTLVDTAQVNETRCVGCGVCVITCPDGALGLVHRPLDEVLPPPETEADWRVMRAAARGLDLKDII
jgi:Fe-S-cluster-containing hydrogenase component 2